MKNAPAETRFVLCADDYSINEPVSAAILELAGKGRLTATSCLVTSRHWPRHATRLKAFATKLDVGLHLNLISDELLEQDPAYRPAFRTYPSHPSLVLRSLSRRLDFGTVVLEIERQLDRFIEGWGASPDYIDGHLHVHLLPLVRSALIDVYQRRLRDTNCYIRNISRVVSTREAKLKAAIIYALGGRGLNSRLNAAGIPHNRIFGGIYSFNENAEYRKLMRAWLRQLEPSSLLMCHPGRYDSGSTDPIGRCRKGEYEYLLSQDFVEDCREMRVSPSRFRDMAHP